EPVVPARDALGGAAARPVAPGADRLPLRACPPPSDVPRSPLRGVRRRRHRLAERDVRRLPALTGLAWSRGRHGGGGLRLALLPRHRAIAHAPRAAAALCRGRGASARRRPAAVALPAVPQPPLPQAPGHGAGRVSVPAVSVLMSVHNGAPWVRDAVASVLAQTAGDLELIVIDDGSTDATSELLAAVRDSRVRTERRAHAGLTRALNRA